MNYDQELKTDILFFAERSLHLPYLEPIHDYLKTAYPHLKLCFSAPPYMPTTHDIAGVGLPDEDIVRIGQKALFHPDSAQILAEMAVIADPCHLSIPHISRVVNVGHGLTCKGLYFCRDNITRRENLSEMMCVPGPWHKRRLEENVFIPIEVTGYIKSDLLFGPEAVDKSKFCADMDINPEKNVILFAPTFNEELSAIPVIKDEISKLAGPESVVLIKLHHMTSPHWVEMYQYLAKENDNIMYLEDADYSGMMHTADVMISDVSSMFIEFMFLNKPVILYRNPRLEEYPNYNPNNIEYRIRDAVQEAESFSELQQEVQTALDNPEMLSSRRRHYIEELDFGQDGQSARRAGDAICSRLIKDTYSSRQEGCFSIFVMVDENTSQEILDKTLNDIADKSSQHSFEILPVGKGSFSHKWSNSTCNVLTGDNQLLSFGKALNLARGNMSVFLKPGWSFPNNWLKWLNNHFLWNKGTGLVKATQDQEFIRFAFENLKTDTRPPVFCKSMSSVMLNLYIGNASVNDMLSSPCAMVPLPVLTACAGAVPSIFIGEAIANLDLLITNMGLASLSALDTIVYPTEQQFFIWDKEALLEIIERLKQEGLMEEAVEMINKFKNLF